jgi:chemotaxis protein MotB
VKNNDAHEEHGSGSERWLVSYADFITLMFAFFAVLYATSEKDLGKTKEFQDSIKKYLIKTGGMGGSGDSGQQLQRAEKLNTPIEPPIQTFKDGKPESVKMLDAAESFVETALSKEEREKFVQDLGADDWGVRIVIPSSAIFGARSDKFKEDAVPFLKKLAGLLAKTNRKILVEGHVSGGETGVFKSTWDFASARAINMIRFVQKTQNLESKKLSMASLADSKPNFEEAGDARNSRLEIVILNPDMEF